MSEMLTTPSVTAAPRSNRIAIVGFIVALVGLLSSWMIVPGVLGLVGFVLGDLGRAKAAQGAEHGRLALWAMVLGGLAVVVSVFALIAVVVLSWWAAAHLGS